jgi:2-polyprenyl-3-methyl-5-hydroxy-6-metoxy-1,4-benzoquinol methylase
MITTQTDTTHLVSTSSMDLSKIENISCPLCQNNGSNQKHRIGSWQIVQCAKCELIYVNPRLEKRELLKIYSSNYFDNREVGYYHYTENKPLRKENFQKWVHDALPFFSNTPSIKALDIGCAAGYCLEVFDELRWKPYGIELDKDLAAALRKNSFTIFDEPLNRLDISEKFHFISLFDVIEHLADLRENMQMLQSLLREDGIIVLVTPNYGSWQRKLFGTKWFQFKPIEHINYFDRKSLQKLAKENSFDIVTIKNSGQFCDIAFLENRLKKYRFQFLLPLFYFLVKIFGLRHKHFYVDTASLYVILRKKKTAP